MDDLNLQDYMRWKVVPVMRESDLRSLPEVSGIIGQHNILTGVQADIICRGESLHCLQRSAPFPTPKVNRWVKFGQSLSSFVSPKP